MSEGTEVRLSRVEQAFCLLPTLELLTPLRTALIAAARPDPVAHWAVAERYLTLGKWLVDPSDLRQRMPSLLAALTTHVSTLYECCWRALDGQQRGDFAAVVEALRSAGRLESRAGRLAQARAWYGAAHGVAAPLADRDPEIDVLLSLGRLEATRGRPNEAARSFQRALALAERGENRAAAFGACLGLGETTLRQGALDGARAWLQRAGALAGEAADERDRIILDCQWALLARRRGDAAGARARLSSARRRLELLGDASLNARVLIGEGRLEAERGRTAAAAGALAEALAWAQRVADDQPELTVEVRLRSAELQLSMGRVSEAEHEMRSAERLAIHAALLEWLVRIYTRMGVSYGQMGDDNAFVFFEQALDLCRHLERPPLLEARVYYEYGEFRRRLGGDDEARAYLEQACSLLECEGEEVQLREVREALSRVGERSPPARHAGTVEGSRARDP